MQRKIPMRQCMGCRERKPKRELIRVVRSPEGVVSLDFRGRLRPGRLPVPGPQLFEEGRAIEILREKFRDFHSS